MLDTTTSYVLDEENISAAGENPARSIQVIRRV